MKILVYAVIFLSPPWLKKVLIRTFFKGKIGKKVKIGWFSIVAGRSVVLEDYSKICPLTIIILYGDVKIGRHSIISSLSLFYGASSLIVGQHCYIAPQCLINVEKPVIIGDQSGIGPRTMIYTHGSFLPYTEGYWVSLDGVTIGNSVWCAAGVFIQPGASIGDDTFISPRSVVSGVIPAGAIVAGNPARLGIPMSKIKRVMTPEKVDGCIEDMLKEYSELILQNQMGINKIVRNDEGLEFKWRDRLYQVKLIPSNQLEGKGASSYEPSVGVQRIYIVNRCDWVWDSRSLVIDMRRNVIGKSNDAIYTSLRLFMQRYYGIKFDYGFSDQFGPLPDNQICR